MQGMPQVLKDHKKMGIYLHKKGISTGILTRIVTNIMEQNKASLEKFVLQLFLLLLMVFTLFALFSNNMYTVALISLVLSSNLKVAIQNVLNMCVKHLLVTLTVCKSLLHIY